LCPESPLSVRLPDAIAYYDLPLQDAMDQDLTGAIDTLGDLIGGSEATPVLVHCRAGASRSAALVASVLMRRAGLCLPHAIAWLKRCRAVVDPNPGFLLQLAARPMGIARSSSSSRPGSRSCIPSPLQNPASPLRSQFGFAGPVVCTESHTCTPTRTPASPPPGKCSPLEVSTPQPFGASSAHCSGIASPSSAARGVIASPPGPLWPGAPCSGAQYRVYALACASGSAEMEWAWQAAVQGIHEAVSAAADDLPAGDDRAACSALGSQIRAAFDAFSFRESCGAGVSEGDGTHDCVLCSAKHDLPVQPAEKPPVEACTESVG
jgi:hypothetical protein